ncbi:MAG: hypothetical protein HC915_08800 [Anaerolineae bacterium]|nr:hypothetical protein [Anaerolineae bacterium]
MKQASLFLLIVWGLFLAGCGDSDSGNTPNSSANIAPIQWSDDPETIVLRFDERRNESPAIEQASDIPLCTLWGDGRLVWINPLEERREVLEARLTSDEIRALIETVIFSGFYSWQSDFILPNAPNPAIQSVTLNVADSERTVSRFSDWPAAGFTSTLEACQAAAETRALFRPLGAWISAEGIVREERVPYWQWPGPGVGFTLAELEAGGPRWVEDSVASFIWEW